MPLPRPRSTNRARDNYRLLARLFGGSLNHLPESALSTAGNRPPLVFERRNEAADTVEVFIGRLYEGSSDTFFDPAVVIRINNKEQTVMPVSYHDIFGSWDVQNKAVFGNWVFDPKSLVGRRMRALEYGRQHDFLSAWFSTCFEHGHRFTVGKN